MAPFEDLFTKLPTKMRDERPCWLDLWSKKVPRSFHLTAELPRSAYSAAPASDNWRLYYLS